MKTPVIIFLASLTTAFAQTSKAESNFDLLTETPKDLITTKPLPKANDPFVKGGEKTPKAEAPAVRPTNYQVVFETFDLSREDFLALLDEKGDDDVRYRRVTEWLPAARTKLTGFTAITAKSGQRVFSSSADEVRYPTRFDPPHIGEETAFPTAYETRNAGDSFDLEFSIAEDGKTASVSLAPRSTTLLSFVDEIATPAHPNSAVGQPRFAMRTFVTNVTTQIDHPRLVGTLSGTGDEATPTSHARVAFLTVRRNVIPAPQPAEIVKGATQSRIEYTFFSLDRPAARELLLKNPEPQACYDGLRSFVAEKKARLEHLSISTTRFGQQTRSDETREIPFATGWSVSRPAGISRTAVPPTASELEIKNAGFFCQIEPQMGPDGSTIDMNYQFEFVRSLGALQVTGIAKTYPPQPLFETRKLNANVAATAGKQQFIGTFNLPNESGVNGRIDDGRVWLGFVRAVLVK